MAGGIDWLRWHHGSVTDPKFGLVAKKAGASVAEVIAVWACLLEAASAADERGNPGEPDFESMDFLLGLEDGTAERIYQRMGERALLDQSTGRIASWDKRQPKREREDDSSTARVRAHRERQNQADQGNRGNAGNATPSHVTPCNAKQRSGTPREEERRVEESINPLSLSGSKDAEKTTGKANPPPVPPDPPEPLDPQSKIEAVLATLPEPIPELWVKWLEVYRSRYGPMPEIQQESVLLELLRREGNMQADLEFSIRKGAKSILDHTSDYQKQTGSRGGSGSKSLTKGERIKQEAGF